MLSFAFLIDHSYILIQSFRAKDIKSIITNPLKLLGRIHFTVKFKSLSQFELVPKFLGKFKIHLTWIHL